MCTVYVYIVRIHGMVCVRIQGEVLRIVGVEPPPPGCQPTMLELKTSTMHIVRLPLDYAGKFEEVVDHDRLYTTGTLTATARFHRRLSLYLGYVTLYNQDPCLPVTHGIVPYRCGVNAIFCRGGRGEGRQTMQRQKALTVRHSAEWKVSGECAPSPVWWSGAIRPAEKFCNFTRKFVHFWCFLALLAISRGNIFLP